MVDQPVIQSSNPPSVPRPPRRRMIAAALVTGLLFGSVAGGAAGAALVSRAPRSVSTTASGSSAVAAPAGSAAALYQQSAPSIVTISTERARTGSRSFAEGIASGVVVDQSGDIVTNAHVVSGASQIQVTFSDGRTASGTVKGIDASMDLAVVQVSTSGLHPIPLGNSDTVQVGEPAYAIGSPFGLSGTLTSGIISGLNRSSTAPNGRALSGLIQTDAPINPGNSGGALLNAQGALIGINASIQSPIEGSVGVGFAIPINTARRLLPDLERGVAVEHPWLGISGQSVTPGVADTLGLSQRSGVLVVEVVTGGPAAQAGLQATGSPSAEDDIITALDGKSLTTVEALTQVLDTHRVGDGVALTVVRWGKTITVNVTLANFQSR